MKNFSFIILLINAIAFASSCEPAHQGSYEAPARSIDDKDEPSGDLVLKIDSSVEKAIGKDTTKRNYHL